jgi:hypothetical protein
MNDIFKDYMQISGIVEGIATQFSAELWRAKRHATSARSFSIMHKNEAVETLGGRSELAISRYGHEER